MGWLGATKHTTYMIENSVPNPKHCKAIASQKSNGLSSLSSTAPKPNGICIVRRLLNNLNPTNANATITTKSIDITGIGCSLQLR
jgi:hypothetical protein